MRLMIIQQDCKSLLDSKAWKLHKAHGYNFFPGTQRYREHECLTWPFINLFLLSYLILLFFCSIEVLAVFKRVGRVSSNKKKSGKKKKKKQL